MSKMANEIPVEAPGMHRLMQKAVKMGVPAGGTFELTPVCNYSCKMCYVRKTQQQVDASQRPIMSLREWMILAESCQQEGTLNLLLTGGEPLVWNDFWQLYESLHRMGFLVSVNTNGSLIDDTAIRIWKMHPPARVNVTLYGACDETYRNLCRQDGQFAHVFGNILKLKASGIPVKVNCSLTPDNSRDLESMVNLTEEHGLVLSVNTYMFPPIRRLDDAIGRNARFTPEQAAAWELKRFRLQNGEERYAAYLRQLRERTVHPPGLEALHKEAEQGGVSCRAGRATFWMTWDGWMTSCGMLAQPCSDWREKGFRQAWREILSETRRLHLSSVCGKCKNRMLCHSCAAAAIAETGRASGVPLYLCRMIAEMRRLAGCDLSEGYTLR